MSISDINRKFLIAGLDARIATLRIAMNSEQAVTDRWKLMARQLSRLINERNSLRTPLEVSDIERRRGLA